MAKVSFVIPCYRSAATLPGVVREIDDTMQALSEYGYEIVLVNDSPEDNTFEVICKLSEENPTILGINLSKNFGQHAALMAGFHYASGDVIVCLDDDGQTPANEVGKLLDEIEAGRDVVYARYPERQQSGFRSWGSRVNSRMAEYLLEKPKNLTVNSYFAMRRFVMEEMLRYEQCYPYVIGLVLRTTRNISNVDVNHRRRTEGRSGYTLRKLVGLWFNGFTSFSVRPLRLASMLGCALAFAGFLYIIVIVIRYFAYHAAPLGWSSTAAIILLLGGINLLFLGLIGEYVGRVFMCVNASPQYVIREVVVAKQTQARLKTDKELQESERR